MMEINSKLRKSADFPDQIHSDDPVSVPDKGLSVVLEVIEEHLWVVTLADGREAAEDADATLRPAPSPGLHGELGRQFGVSDLRH